MQISVRLLILEKQFITASKLGEKRTSVHLSYKLYVVKHIVLIICSIFIGFSVPLCECSKGNQNPFCNWQ